MIFINCFLVLIIWSPNVLGQVIDMQKAVLPPTESGPVTVSVGLYINSMNYISERNMDFSVTMYYRESWTDQRIKISPNMSKQIIPESQRNEIWFPDIFIRNEKDSKTHNLMVENRLLMVKNIGSVWHVRKLTVTMGCPMTFQKFPFDTQECPIIFESFSYTMDTIVLRFLDHPLDLDDRAILPKYLYKGVNTVDCSQNYTTGSYPCLSLALILKRDTSPYVHRFYIPTILFVLLAWFSFWVKIDSSKTRMILSSIAVYLTFSANSAAKADLPQFGYMTASDIWTMICLLFISSSLVIHVIINYMVTSHGSPPLSTPDVESVTENGKESHDNSKKSFIEIIKKFILEEKAKKVTDTEKNRRRANFINAVAKLVFFLVFVLVIIIYFSIVGRW